jgi:hypothetical protein
VFLVSAYDPVSLLLWVGNEIVTEVSLITQGTTGNEKSLFIIIIYMDIILDPYSVLLVEILSSIVMVHGGPHCFPSKGRRCILTHW